MSSIYNINVDVLHKSIHTIPKRSAVINVKVKVSRVVIGLFLNLFLSEEDKYVPVILVLVLVKIRFKVLWDIMH